jgi:hypothetical protein
LQAEIAKELISRTKPKWEPLPGAQSLALESKADILFYGGAAGGGKTDLILGAAYTKHTRSIIFRREYPQLKGIIDRSIEIFSGDGRLNKADLFWAFPNGRQIEFGAVQLAGDERKYQGRPHDLKAFDELAHFTELQFRTLIGWLRSAKEGQRCRVIAAGNPPTTPEGEWIVNFFAPWLDPKHPHPALPGELRWFTTINGKDIERPDSAPFDYEGDVITPLSRTFIPASVKDNPHYLNSGYMATLQALPEPLRSKMLFGDFQAGTEDDPYQVIPTDWVYKAQERWRQRHKPNTPLTALGIDVARGGSDKTIITARYDNYIAEQIVHPGSTTPNGQAIAQLAKQAIDTLNGNPASRINIDVIGVGSSPYDWTKAIHDRTYAMNASEGSEARDKSGQLAFVNKRAEWYWKLRESLDPASGQDLALPDDRELLVDLCAPHWQLKPRGIQIELKEDIIKRIGRSPDKGDSLVYACALDLGVGDNLLSYYASLNLPQVNR